MALARSSVVPGMTTEYEAFAELLRCLTPEEWEAPTRCDGWRVADVAAHVVGQLSDVTNLRLEGLGTDEVTARQVDERRGRSAAELAAELDAATKTAGELAAGFDDAAWDQPGPQGDRHSLGFGLEALWFDTYLHADDIRDALGQKTVNDSGIVASVSHLTQVLTDQGWGPATVQLTGVEEFPVSGGGGKVVTGDPMAFVLAASGRTDPDSLGLDETVNIYR